MNLKILERSAAANTCSYNKITITIQQRSTVTNNTSYSTFDFWCFVTLFFLLADLHRTCHKQKDYDVFFFKDCCANNNDCTVHLWPIGDYAFYRAMHFSAKRGIAIVRILSVCPSICV